MTIAEKHSTTVTIFEDKSFDFEYRGQVGTVETSVNVSGTQEQISPDIQRVLDSGRAHFASYAEQAGAQDVVPATE